MARVRVGVVAVACWTVRPRVPGIPHAADRSADSGVLERVSTLDRRPA